MRALGIDTSNYTTSAAVFDGSGGYNAGRLLEVRPGELGLRQSDALFQHIKHLPGRFAELRAEGWLTGLSAVGASARPRAVEGSYMPCFLAGEGQGRTLADALGVPFYAVSHQQGHIAAAAWSAGRLELLDRPMLAWHLSGGTTELLYVEPDGVNVRAQCVGGTSDISAGQLIDRTGVLLGLPFPAGKMTAKKLTLLRSAGRRSAVRHGSGSPQGPWSGWLRAACRWRCTRHCTASTDRPRSCWRCRESRSRSSS